MKSGKQYNTFSKQEYISLLETNKKEINSLGLYRSISENENLSIAEKIEIRELSHSIFQKSFDFLQLKDPFTYFRICTIGEEFSIRQRSEFMGKIVIPYQEKILKEKRFGHRNFGDYSKHMCGDETCIYNGMMVKEGSYISEGRILLHSDKNPNSGKLKSIRNKKYARKFKRNLNKFSDYE